MTTDNKTDKILREAIAKTVVEILGEKSNIMYIRMTSYVTLYGIG